MKIRLYDSKVSQIYENGRKLSLFALAIPIFFELASVGLLSTANTLMLSGYSQDAVGAIGVVGQLLQLFTSFLMITVYGLRIILGLELGRGNKTMAELIMGTAFWMVLISSIILGCLGAFFAEPLLELMNLDGSPKMIAIGYMRISACGLFLTLLKSYFTISLITNGYSKQASIATIITQALNVLFGYIVLYGKFGLPFEEIEGLAVSTILAQIIGIVIALYSIKKNKCPFSLTFEKGQVGRILNIGIPASMCALAYTVGQTITTSIIASFGIDVMNAKVYVSSITTYVYYFSSSVGQASAVLMGRFRGREEFDKIDKLFWQCVRLGVVMNAIVVIVVFILRTQLLGLFTSSPDVIAVASTAMFIDIFVETIRGATNVGDQCLNANGDVRFVLLVSVAACFLVTVLLSYILGVKLGLGLAGCWMAFAIDELFKTTFYLIRWKGGKWKKQII